MVSWSACSQVWAPATRSGRTASRGSGRSLPLAPEPATPCEDANGPKKELDPRKSARYARLWLGGRFSTKMVGAGLARAANNGYPLGTPTFSSWVAAAGILISFSVLVCGIYLARRGRISRLGFVRLFRATMAGLPLIAAIFSVCHFREGGTLFWSVAVVVFTTVVSVIGWQVSKPAHRLAQSSRQDKEGAP